MANRLTWIFELYDKMSGPGRRISRELERVEKELEKVNTAQRRLKASKLPDGLKKQTEMLRLQREELRALGAETKRTGDGWGWFGLKLAGWLSIARMAMGALGGLARGGMNIGGGIFGAGIRAASFKQSTMLGLSNMLRSPDLAQRLFAEAQQFADITPFGTEETVGWYRQLTPFFGTKGLGSKSGTLIKRVLSGLGDLAAQSANPQQAMDSIMLQVTQMLSQGRLLGTELRPILQTGVIDKQSIYRELAKKRGISLTEALSTKWEGQFGAGEALAAILRVSQERYGKGTLGGGMGPASETLQGIWSTVKSRPFALMQDIYQTGGFKAMEQALRNLRDVLDPRSESGKRIKANIEQLFDKTLGGVFRQFQDPAAVERWVNALVTGLERLLPRIERFAKSLGVIAEKGATIAEWLAERIQPPTDMDRARNTLSGSFGSPTFDAAKNARRVIEAAGGRLTPEEERIYREAERTWHGWPGPNSSMPMRFPPLKTTPPAGPKTSQVIIHPGAIQIQTSGAQDPEAVGDAVEERLVSVFERMAMQMGA